MEKIQKIIDNLFEKDIKESFKYYENLKDFLDKKDISDVGYMYILNCDRYEQHIEIEFEESTYKIGKTETNLKTRLKQYHPKVNIKCIHAIQCKNPSQRESLLKFFISNKTSLIPCVGQEYFLGNFNFLRILLYIFANIPLYWTLEDQDDDVIENEYKTSTILNNANILVNIIYKLAIEKDKSDFIFLDTLLTNKEDFSLNNYSMYDELKEETKEECIFCKKKFSTKSGLNVHMKTAKFCIESRESSNELLECENLNCEFCKKVFTVKSSFQRHLLKCKEKNIYIIEKLKKEKIEDIEIVNRKHKEDIEIMNKKHKEEIDIINKKNEDELIKLSELKNKTLEQEKIIIRIETINLYLKEQISELNRKNDLLLQKFNLYINQTNNNYIQDSENDSNNE